MNEKNVLSWLLFILGVLVIGMSQQGCTSTAGWKVSFGVSPVASIHETQQTVDGRVKK